MENEKTPSADQAQQLFDVQKRTVACPGQTNHSVTHDPFAQNLKSSFGIFSDLLFYY